MPKVGKKEYGYGPKGMAAAHKEAMRTGKPVMKPKAKDMPMRGKKK